MRISAVDIGTNTCLMVILEFASSKNSEYSIVADYHNVTRLGEGVSSTKFINDNAVRRTCEVLEFYKNESNSKQVDCVVAVGTSALRDALNKNEVLQQLSTSLGAKVQVINGIEEARLSYLGSAENTDSQSLLLDIGGGSTEIALGNSSGVLHRQSVDIGAVRLTEKYLQNIPPTESQLQECKHYIRESLRTNISDEFKNAIKVAQTTLIGVAGTPTTLAAVQQSLNSFDFQRVHGFELQKNQVENLVDTLQSKTLEQLLNTPGVHEKRADIIVAGSLILQQVMEFFDFKVCRVSAKGLRYGVAMSAFGMLKFRSL